jgi:hypothetical protein
VKQLVSQLPWRQNIDLLERLDDEKTRLVNALGMMPPRAPAST